MLSTVGTRNLRIITIALCVVGVVLLFRNGFSSETSGRASNINTLDNYPAYKAAFAITRACLMNELQSSNFGQFWNKSLDVVNNCAAGTDVNMQGFQNGDETKYHIPPKDEGTTCNVITLGVGRDTGAEVKMKAKMPQCNFFGADPASELNEDLYTKIGKFFKTAVGPKDADLTQFVFETKDNWTHYYDKTVPTRDIYKFVKEDAKLSVVDQIMIDIEKTEYDIVDRLLRKNTPEDIVLCQINIEFHPRDDETKKVYYSFLKSLVEEGHILPLKGTTLWPFDVKRLFFLNIRDSICQERFFYPAEKTNT